MSAQMPIDVSKPPKLDLDQFIGTAISATPAELHPYFESFRTLHTRKWVTFVFYKLGGTPHVPILQTMAPAYSKAFWVLRCPFEQTVPGWDIRKVRARLWNKAEPTSTSRDGSKGFERDRQWVDYAIVLPESCTWRMVLSALDPQTHLTFLTSFLSRIDTKKSQEAHVLLLATIAHAKLLYGDLEGTKTEMDAAWKVLDDLNSVDNTVNAAYYGVAADYYKVCPDQSSFGMKRCWRKCRRKRSMHLITEIHYSSWPASILRRICQLRNASPVPTISESLRSWEIRSITSVNLYVPVLRININLKGTDAPLVAHAPNIGCVGRNAPWMDQKATVYLQRR